MSDSVNRRIVAIAKDDPPFSYPCVFNNSCGDKNAGINIEIFKAVIELLGYDYVIIRAEENASGYIDDKGNMRGMVHQLMNYEANMTASAINIDNVRLQGADYSAPISYYSYGFLIRRRDAAEAMAVPSFLATPFQPEVWLAFLFWMLINVLLFFALAHSSDKHRRRQGKMQLLSDSLLTVIRTPVSQVENSHGDENTTKRLMMVLFQIPMLFLMNYYVAGLTSRLMVPHQPGLPFSSIYQLAELVSRGDFTLVDSGESSKWPTDGDDPLAVMRRSFAWNPPVFAENSSHLVQLLTGNGSLVHVSSYYSVLSAASLSCQTQVVADQSTQQWLAFAFRKGDPLRGLVSQALYKSASIYDFSEHLYKKYFNERRCEDDHDDKGFAGHIDEPKNFFPLSLLQVQGAYFTVLFGCGLAFISGCAELVVYRFCNRSLVRAI